MKKKIFIVVTLVLVLTTGLLIVYNIPHINAMRLCKAIKSRNYDKVEKLLETGIDPNVTTTSNITEVMLNFVESTGERPLTVACEVGDISVVRLLIEYGATAEPSDCCGWSPLNQTLLYYQSNDKEIVELLLENGAYINEENPFGVPIFNAAAMVPKEYDKQENGRVIFVNGYDEKVAQGITDIVKMLLEHGEYDVNLKSSYNNTTLLIEATKSGNRFLVEHLLSEGCDVNQKDNSNKSALDYAEANSDFEIVDLLIDYSNKNS